MLEAAFGILFAAIIAWALSSRSHLRLRVRLELLLAVLVILVLASYIVAKRFSSGLGAVSNMSDSFPWGIWITFDLCGVALAAGGFLIAATVHVFHLRRFEPILRPTVLTSFIAYVLVAAVLVLDLGRPQRFWHPLVMWQHHSVMFEITLCLSLYTIVLALEFSPVLFERLGLHHLTIIVHRLALPVVMLGVVLSTLHQSSFGSLFLIVPEKLHPLWYTPLLPVIFLVSAVCAGLAVVIGESLLCARYLGTHLKEDILASLARAASKVLWVLLALRLADLAWRGAWRHVADVPWLSGMFALELIVGVLIPAWGFGRTTVATAPRLAGRYACLVIAGVVLNRTDVSWLGLLPYTGYSYVPSWMEWVTTGALSMLGVLAFVAISRFTPVFYREEAPAGTSAGI